jgi:hypothetical protein
MRRVTVPCRPFERVSSSTTLVAVLATPDPAGVFVDRVLAPPPGPTISRTNGITGGCAYVSLTRLSGVSS